jgi:hypothetical protein
MENQTAFGEILEAADHLSLEDQESLIDILRSRMRDRRRAELAEDVQEAKREFEQGRCRAVTPDELMGEILL